MCCRLVFILLLQVLSGFFPAAADAREDAAVVPAPAVNRPDALEVFRVLPSTIFENTPEGLSEDDKERLLGSGESEYWMLLPAGSDSLELVSLPFGDTRIFLHVYQYAKSGEMLAVIGSTHDELCTLELWRMTGFGGFRPADAPPEPPITDFFAKGNKMPGDVQASILFCPNPGGLDARAVFWNTRGKAYVPVDNDVRYEWNGEKFEKRVLRKEKK
jgi:hypothetical protein